MTLITLRPLLALIRHSHSLCLSPSCLGACGLSGSAAVLPNPASCQPKASSEQSVQAAEMLIAAASCRLSSSVQTSALSQHSSISAVLVLSSSPSLPQSRWMQAHPPAPVPMDVPEPWHHQAMGCSVCCQSSSAFVTFSSPSLPSRHCFSSSVFAWGKKNGVRTEINGIVTSDGITQYKNTGRRL